MSDVQQEMDEALDKLEAEHGNLDESNDNQFVLDESQVTLDENVINKEEKEKPPGYLSYDEWIGKGKDPADYKGENAYKAEYDRIHEIRDLKSTMNQVVEGMNTWQQQQRDQMDQQIEQARTDAGAELAQAKEDDDLPAALQAQDKLNKLDSQPSAKPVQVNPVISDFAKKNPIVDTESAQYDAEFHQDMIMIHNGKLDQLLGGDRARAGELTQAQIERVQKLAFSQAKELHADKFTSARNRRPTPASPSQRSSNNSGNASTRLKDVAGNARNSRDTSPANDIYELIKAKDPKQAEIFAKSLTGE